MSSPRRVALATAAEAVGRDEDEPVLIDALAAEGITAAPLVWDDPAARWQDHDLVLVRSTWDYTHRLAEFLDWAERVEQLSVLHNPARVLRWNTDKRYLGELAEDGVHVAPTVFLDPADPTARDRVDTSVRAAAARSDVVVKPAVSAGSRDTERHDRDATEAAEAHVHRLLDGGRVAMVQPYLARVDEQGETGMVFLGGELCHAFRKAPLLLEGRAPVDGLFAPERITPREPDEHELALATHTIERATARCGVSSLLYARVDVLADDGGRPTLLELELTEPSWFLGQSSEAPQRAAAAIAALL